MKKILLASAALALVVGQAEAQDGGYSWSGFYVGAQGGYVFSSADFSGTSAVPAGDRDEDGFIGGVHVGHDWQNGRWVWGFVGDVNYVDVDGVALSGENLLGKDEDYTYDVDWVATARARVGFLPTERLLVYGTGGAAFAHLEATEALEQFGGAVNRASNSNVEVGGVLGFGAEFALTPNWSLKTEYLHHDFGKLPTAPGDSEGTGFSSSLDTVTVGVSFKFGP